MTLEVLVNSNAHFTEKEYRKKSMLQLIPIHIPVIVQPESSQDLKLIICPQLWLQHYPKIKKGGELQKQSDVLAVFQSTTLTWSRLMKYAWWRITFIKRKAKSANKPGSKSELIMRVMSIINAKSWDHHWGRGFKLPPRHTCLTTPVPPPEGSAYVTRARKASSLMGLTDFPRSKTNANSS